jgi:ABC-type transport system involved in multi-copper enzyme maturation permease subunit
MATKLAVLAAAAALLGVVAEGLWLLGARLLAATRGSTAVAPHLAGQLLSGAGRGVLLVVLVGLLGFGVANLLRNTAAAFGFGFVYFAIVENVVRALRPHWQPYLLTDNAVALLQRGGLKIFYDEGVVDSRGFFRGSREVVLTNLHGAVVLAVVTAVVVGAGIVSFVRRDLD